MRLIRLEGVAFRQLMWLTSCDPIPCYWRPRLHKINEMRVIHNQQDTYQDIQWLE
uniref:Uncharacterized protein n=1 Tax=Arundo donax TaxID=35708 RepID=A0A0A9GX67_ARUDO